MTKLNEKQMSSNRDVVAMVLIRGTYKVTTNKGRSWVSSFNGTLAEAKAYYVGNYFDVGGPEGPEDMQKVESVEEV